MSQNNAKAAKAAKAMACRVGCGLPEGPSSKWADENWRIVKAPPPRKAEPPPSAPKPSVRAKKEVGAWDTGPLEANSKVLHGQNNRLASKSQAQKNSDPDAVPTPFESRNGFAAEAARGESAYHGACRSWLLSRSLNKPRRAPRDGESITSLLMGDPPPGRSALDGRGR
jgi:hypothetical protein